MLKLSACVLVILVVVCANPILATSPQSSAAIGADVQRSILYAPKPDYPLEARAHHLAGAEVFVMRVHVNSGRVIEVWAGRSTGHAILDQATVCALGRWRFKPNTLSPSNTFGRHDSFGKEDALIKVPISFTM
jgi:TonB family protein